jgi:hypothetical protein
LTWNVVTDAPCQEIVLQGAALDRPGAALDGIPGADLDPGLGQRTQPTARTVTSGDGRASRLRKHRGS